MEIHSDRTYGFDLPPAALWDALTGVQHYRRWWPWLRSFDGAGLVEGQVWSCVVQPPLPYVVRFDLTLEEVLAPRFIRATASGDVVGSATLDIRPLATGGELRLRSSLAPRNELLRVFAAVARPLVRRGHDWVLDTGARQFRGALPV